MSYSWFCVTLSSCEGRKSGVDLSVFLDTASHACALDRNGPSRISLLCGRLRACFRRRVRDRDVHRHRHRDLHVHEQESAHVWLLARPSHRQQCVHEVFESLTRAAVTGITITGGSGGSAGDSSPGLVRRQRATRLRATKGAQLQLGAGITLPVGQQNAFAFFVGTNGADVSTTQLGVQQGPIDNSQAGANGGSAGAASQYQGAAGGSASVIELNGNNFAIAGAGGE